MSKFTSSLLTSWKRIVAVAALIAIWLIWGVHRFRPNARDELLAKLPSFGAVGVTTVDEPELRPLVLYTYSESEIARKNLEFFVRKGVNEKADFVFIFNGETTATEMVPKGPNIQVVQRQNTCFDIGAHGEVLRKDDLWKKYKRFILMNASVRGPFIPSYISSCWMDIFLGRITDKVKLVGTTLNCSPRPHVQSMVLATDDVGMAILLDPGLAQKASTSDHYGTSMDPVGLTPCFSTLKKAVHAEIGITPLIKSQGYEVDVMMTAPHSAASFEAFCNEAGKPDDFLYPKKYFGSDVHPYEVLFMKANRDIDPALMDKMTEWHMTGKMKDLKSCVR